MLACILKQEMKVTAVVLVVTVELDATTTTRTTDLRCLGGRHELRWSRDATA
jgi:hypothetical protein